MVINLQRKLWGGETPGCLKLKQPITGYHKDQENHWVAQLACGHNQHVRNDPPWFNRPWVETVEGRQQKLGVLLDCLKCDRNEALDRS